MKQFMKKQLTGLLIGFGFLFFLIPSVSARVTVQVPYGYCYFFEGIQNGLPVSFYWYHYNPSDNHDDDTIPDIEEDRNKNCYLDDNETSTTSADSDGDGIRDDYEIGCFGIYGDGAYVADPRDKSLKRATTGALPDCSLNSNLLPVENDIDDDGTINARDTDSDGDRICDGYGNTDGCELKDGGAEILTGEDHLFNPETETNPYNSDTDGDEQNDRLDSCRFLVGCSADTGGPDLDPEVDYYTCHAGVTYSSDVDHDGLLDYDEDVDKDCNYFPTVSTEDLETSPFLADSDGDLINDAEDKCRWFPGPAGNDSANFVGDVYDECSDKICRYLRINPDPDQDTDEDGLSDQKENPGYATNCDLTQRLDLDPLKADTDGDGFNDKEDICPWKLNNRVDGAYLNTPEGIPASCYSDLCLYYQRNPNPTLDTDGDGLTDIAENPGMLSECSFSQEFDTHPYKKDTDGDGFDDNSDLCRWTRNLGTPPTNTGAESIPLLCQDKICRYLQDTPNETLDSDHDGLPDMQEDKVLDCNYEGYLETDPFDPDSDDDGFPDGSDLCPWLPNTDNSGVNLPEECQAILCESRRDGLSPTLDTDRDGLTDMEEDADRNCTVDIELGETNPYLTDTDDDGIPDTLDCVHDTGTSISPEDFEGGIPTTEKEMHDARLLCRAYVPYPKAKDCDRDGLPNRLEDKSTDCVFQSTGGINGETDPFNPDTDADEILDGIEDADKDGQVDKDETNPRKADSDEDDIPDGLEDWHDRGIRNFDESSPNSQDSDNDGIPDNIEDFNRDGRCDVLFNELGRPLPLAEQPVGGEISCAYLQDTDYDGLKDGVEDRNKNGIADFDEPDPRVQDTDGDGVPDGREDINGNGQRDEGETDPTSASTYGQGDMAYINRQRGIDQGCGCTVAGSAAPGLQGVAMALMGLALAAVRRMRKK